MVARVGDDGYVIKQLCEWDRQSVTLTSFNPDFAPILRARSDIHVLGVMMACFRASLNERATDE